jgi:hypothetical protein
MRPRWIALGKDLYLAPSCHPLRRLAVGLRIKNKRLVRVGVPSISDRSGPSGQPVKAIVASQGREEYGGLVIGPLTGP